DHARDAAQVQWLLPAARGCAVVVTSRRRMIDLPGAHLVELDVMSPDEALQLLTRITGRPRPGEHSPARYVVAACGFLPLAIRTAACRLLAHRTWTVFDLAHQLADENTRLDELQAGNLAVKPVIDNSYHQLNSAEADAFRTLSSSTDALLSLQETARLLGRDAAAAEHLAETLIDAGLLTSIGSGTYQIPLLAQLYAKALPHP
ncbi:AfsR family transcriptional regulator, partial [Streptomyces chartreusis]